MQPWIVTLLTNARGRENLHEISNGQSLNSERDLRNQSLFKVMICFMVSVASDSVVRSWCSCGAKPYPSRHCLRSRDANRGAHGSGWKYDVCWCLLMFVVDQSPMRDVWWICMTCHHIFHSVKGCGKPNNKPSPNSPEMDGINPPKLKASYCVVLLHGVRSKRYCN